MKNKILIFNGYYYPSKNSGGPITSIENTVNACCDEFDFYIIAYNHDFNSSEPYDVPTMTWVPVGNAHVMYVPKNKIDFSLSQNYELINNLKPDLVWFSGVLTPNNKLVTVRNCHKLNIPVLFSPRGEVSADRVSIKGYKKVPYLKLISLLQLYKNSYYHATSQDEKRGIEKFFKPLSNHLFFSANISVQKQSRVVSREKIKNQLKVIFFSRIQEVKNLDYALNAIIKCKENIEFDIYGPIESSEYWEKCQKIIELAPNNVKINYRGIIERNDLSRVIQSYDCFIFPTINENYGHVIAESLANNVPVLLSKGTTPWDDLHNRAGFVIELSDQNGFSDRLDYLADLDNNDFQKLKISAEDYFDEKIKNDQAVIGHREMFRKIIDKE